MRKIYFLLYSALSVFTSAQTILNQTESSSRTVQDPNVVVLAPGFHAASSVSNPFVAKIGDATENPGGGPSDSGAGTGNPSGTTDTENSKFHDTRGNIEVNGGGQLQFTLPIALPPGVKSVAPQINLVYTSGSGNGIAGYGWNISGITSISRIGKNIEKDGEVKGVQLDYSDYYSFNGQRLILKSGEYGKDGAEYITEKFSNIKVKSLGSVAGQQWQGPEYWEVTFEDGSQAWYGATTTGASKARTPVEYNIVKWEDAQGNYITYDYVQDTGSNVARISSIKWGGNEALGKSHFNEIVFNYVTRDLNEGTYADGVQFIQSKLLSSIIVNTNGSQFKKYVIDNTFKNGTNYNFVKSITEYNANNEPGNPVTFDYPQLVAGSVDPDYLQSSDPFDGVKLTGDFNGDSYIDFVMSGSIKLGAFNDNFSTVTTNKTFNSDALAVSTLIDTDGSVYNGNGIVQLEGNKLVGYLFKNNSFQKVYEKQVFENPCSNYSPPDKCILSKKINEGDIDGDGISNAVIEVSANVTVFYPCPENKNEENLNPPPGSCSDTYTIDVGNFIVDLKDVNLPVSTYTKDSGINYSNTSAEKYMDVDGDGKVESINVSNTAYTVFEFVKTGTNQYQKKIRFTNNLVETKQNEFPVLFGDFNGDGKLDFTIPVTDNAVGKPDNWRFYIGKGNGFDNFLKVEFLPYRNRQTDNSGGYAIFAKQYFFAIADMNKDGKSDVIQIFSYNQINWFNTQYRNFGYVVNSKLANGISTDGTIDFTSNLTYQSSQYSVQDVEDLTLFVPLTNPIKANNNYYNVYLYWKQHLHRLKAPTSLAELARMKSISQAGIYTSVIYSELNPDINSNYYSKTKQEYYPYFSSPRVDQTFAVTQLIQNSRKQDFRYRGMTIHLQGRGMIGFRQTARSSWYTDNLEGTKIWSGAEIDPLNDGVPIKEWSIKTNVESQVFPEDLSEGNTQLLSFKSTQYRFDKLLNGAVVDLNAVSPADRAKVVSATIPTGSVSKDFMKDIRTESLIKYDNEDLGAVTERYYLPTKTTSDINNGFAVSVTNLEYLHHPSGAGSDYYIGRPKSKNDQIQVYGDTKGAKEDYTYENNLLESKTSWNRDNSGGFSESYEYDGWGNITEKSTSRFTSSMSNQLNGVIKEKAAYDSQGRFVIKKTDNLGLETLIEYNDWGQVTKQTDPLGGILTNTYDAWGKLLTSKTNLAGTTTYQYKKESNGDTVITEYSPDGDQKTSYTNKLGQNYLNKTKKFGQGQYISVKVDYDALGRKIGESEPYSGSSPIQWNTIAYDEYSRPVTATSFTGKIVTTSYNGRTVTTTETNANNRFKTQTADALGNVISSQDLGGTITFKYNAAGENTEANYEGNIVKTNYDAWGNKVRFEDPSNGVYEYEYNGFMGALSKTKSPKGEKTYEYNNKAQLVKQTEISTDSRATDKVISFTYNSKGLITGKSGTSSGKSYSSGITYDSYGRVLSSFEDSNGKYFIKKGITYDDKMRVSSYEKQLYSSGILTKVSIENEYDAWSGEMYRVKEKATGKILWQLNEVNDKGQVTKARLGGVNIENWYLSNGFLDYIDHKSISTGSTALYVDYTFEAIKNELSSRIRGGDFSINESFQYDANNRLYNWTDPVTGAYTENQLRNTYDNKGRITQNDQVGAFSFGSQKIYRPATMALNAAGTANYTNDLLQRITYNENNDPVFIDGVKGDVAFEYGLTSMRQAVHYGGNFSPPLEGPGEAKFTKYYSEDGSYEIIRNNQTGQEKHLIYIGGTPYESNIVYLKEFTTSTPKFVFLHKDYLGSVLAITDEAGATLEQRHFDAWGNLTHLKIGNNGIITDKEQIRNYLSDGNLIVDRGYTSHEHFAEVGLIHMNGRLYDPLLRRFLNADENIQDPYNTQNYNKYSYVLNNPLMFSDPSGEFVFAAFIAALSKAVFTAIAVTAVVDIGIGIVKGSWSVNGFFRSLTSSAISAMASFGIGELFQLGSVTKFFGNSKFFFQAIAHGASQGTLSVFFGGDFWSGASAAFFSSLSASAAGSNLYAQLTAGAISGGIGSVLARGNFWEGAGIGLIVAGLNHVAHIGAAAIEENSKVKTALRKLNLDPKAKPDFSKEAVIDLTVRDENLNQMYKNADYPSISLDSNQASPGRTNSSGITLGQKAFKSYRGLYLTLGHEFIHAYHYASGMMSYWIKNFGGDRAKYNTERGAYSWLQLYDSPSMKYKWEFEFLKNYEHLNK